jgi:hypothetical protein
MTIRVTIRTTFLGWTHAPDRREQCGGSLRQLRLPTRVEVAVGARVDEPRARRLVLQDLA